MKKKTTGSDDFIPQISERNDLNLTMNNFFVMNFVILILIAPGSLFFGIRPESCPNESLCTVLKNTDFSTKFNLFKSLLNLLPEAKLIVLWNELTGNLKRIIIGKNPEAILSELQDISSPENGVNSGVHFTIKSITNCSQNLKEILNEIEQKNGFYVF
ncbi:MAG: hypothetical protein LBF97_06315 [Elusimicrobiota bacterium]|nr:hypothetical protein [Elusimicrobiota bacterium]